MLTWSLEELRLTLKYTWKIARNTSSHKTNFIVHISDGVFSGKGEVAPNIRYTETPEAIKADFERFMSAKPFRLNSLVDFTKLLDLIAPKQALRFALESAFIHYLAAKNNVTIASILGLPETYQTGTTYTLPIMEHGELKEFFEFHKLVRFPYIKLKVHKDNAIDALNELLEFCKQPIMIDANESWTDVEDQIIFQEQIAHLKQIVFIEQPLPAHMEDEYVYLKQNARFDIFADESVTASPDMSEIKNQFHGVNMKLMKAGGYLNGIEILQNAKAAGLKTMIGCMVETSLGISSGVHITSLCDYVDLDGFFIIENEPYRLAKEENGLIKITGRF